MDGGPCYRPDQGLEQFGLFWLTEVCSIGRVLGYLAYNPGQLPASGPFYFQIGGFHCFYLAAELLHALAKSLVFLLELSDVAQNFHEALLVVEILVGLQ